MADSRIDRIEWGITNGTDGTEKTWYRLDAALADLRAWQGIAERHSDRGWRCVYCEQPCPDRQAADGALDRLDALWSVSE